MSQPKADSQYHLPVSELYLPRLKNKNYEEEWHQQNRRTISKQEAFQHSYITTIANADPQRIKAREKCSDERLRVIYFYFQVLQKFSPQAHPDKRREWMRILDDKPNWETGSDPIHTKSIIRRAYYLFEEHQELAHEFATHLPDGFRMPLPVKHNGATFNIMDSRLDPVREKIWSYLLGSTKHGIEPAGATGDLKNFLLGSTTPALLRLNKETSVATTKILYKQNRFIFAFDEGARAFFWFMEGMNPVNRYWLRRIDLVYNARTYLETTDIFTSAALEWFAGDHGCKPEEEDGVESEDEKPKSKAGTKKGKTSTITAAAKGKGEEQEENPASPKSKTTSIAKDKPDMSPAKRRKTGVDEDPNRYPGPGPAGHAHEPEDDGCPYPEELPWFCWPQASLQELRITIKGDVLFTEDDYVLVVPAENHKVPHSVDSNGKLRTIKVTRPDGRKVTINAKPLMKSSTEKAVLGILDPLQMGPNTGPKGVGRVAPTTTAGGGGAVDAGGAGGAVDITQPVGTQATGRGRGRRRGRAKTRGRGTGTGRGRGKGRGKATGLPGGGKPSEIAPDSDSPPTPDAEPAPPATTVSDDSNGQDPNQGQDQDPSPGQKRKRTPSPPPPTPPPSSTTTSLPSSFNLDQMSPSRKLSLKALQKHQARRLAKAKARLTQPDPSFIPVLFLPHKLLISVLCRIHNIRTFCILGSAMPISLRNLLYSRITPSKRDFISHLPRRTRESAQKALDDESRLPLTLNDMRRVRHIPGYSNQSDAQMNVHMETGMPLPTSNERRFVLGVLGRGWKRRGKDGGEDDGWFSDDGLGVFGGVGSRKNKGLSAREVRGRRKVIGEGNPWGEFVVGDGKMGVEGNKSTEKNMNERDVLEEGEDSTEKYMNNRDVLEEGKDSTEKNMNGRGVLEERKNTTEKNMNNRDVLEGKQSTEKNMNNRDVLEEEGDDEQENEEEVQHGEDVVVIVAAAEDKPESKGEEYHVDGGGGGGGGGILKDKNKSTTKREASRDDVLTQS